MIKRVRRVGHSIAGIFLLAMICGDSPVVVAQPRILTQPRNVAALPGEEPQTLVPGQNAQFRVTATGASPLAYQWRSNGVYLAVSTANSLTLSNVTWSDLGRYDVVVSNAAGAVVSAPAWLMLATRWREMVYFGASEGKVHCACDPWPVQLASRLGLPLRNYAADGAGSASHRAQIQSYLKSYTPTTGTLIGSSFGGGANDLVLGLAVEQAVSNGLTNLRLLAQAGARQFLIQRFYPPGLVPAFSNYPQMTTELVLQFSALFDEGLEELKADYPLTLYRPDLWALFLAIWQDPTLYGFHAPLTAPNGELDPRHEVFCDGAHFTLAANIIVGQEAYRSLTPPLRIDSAVRQPEGDLAFTWSGGSPPFQMQRTADLFTSQWESVGPVGFLSEATVKCESAQGYFRVIFLGQ